MKIKAVRAKLLGGIKAVQDVVKTTDETSPYRNIRVETPTAGSVLLTGSNGNIQIQTRVVCETDGACALTLVGHRLAAFVGSMREGVVEIDVGTGSRARIHGGEAEFSIAKGEANDFPLMKGPDGEGRVEYAIRAGLLVEMLRKVHYAASADRTRPTLMGVLLRTRSALPGMDSVLLAVAADGRRLSVVSVEIGNTGDVDAVLPRELVAVLMKLAKASVDQDLTVACDGRAFRVTADDWSVTAKLVDGAYPNYEQVIPKAEAVPNDVEVDRAEFLENLSRASLATYAENCHVKLTIGGNEVMFESQNGYSRAKAVMAAKYDGPKTVVNFDPKILEDALSCIDEDFVHLRFMDGKNPFVVTCSVPFKCIVMPIRDNKEA